MKISSLVLGSSLAAMIMVGSVAAAPITYTFAGTGAGALDGVSFSSFTVTLTGDTSNITSGGGEYADIVGTATVSTNAGSDALTGAFNEVIVNNSTQPSIGFLQAQSTAPFAVAEAVENSSLTTYYLSTTYPLTTGPVSFSPSTYDTANGTFVLSSLSSLSFEATSAVSAAPEPSSWAMMVFGVTITGGMLRFGRRRSLAAAA